MAASFAVKTFNKKLRNIHVLIQINNAKTIAYTNKMGGGAKRCLLDHYARHLWSWCLQRRITLRAEHIAGCLKTITDRESRAKLDSSDWRLNQNYFQTLIDKIRVSLRLTFLQAEPNTNFPDSFQLQNPTQKQRKSMS